MFNNIRYVDPKLYFPHGKPDFNNSITPEPNVQFPFDYGPDNTPYGKVKVLNGLVAYDANTDYGNFSSIEDARNRTGYNGKTVIIKQINSNGSSHVSGYTDSFRQRFLGYIYCTEEGTYNFRSNSDDSSVVAVDGVQVAAYGVSGNNQQNITLGVGLHKLEYYHAEQSGDQSWCLYWKTPSNSSWVVIPSSNLFYAEDMVWHEVNEVGISEYSFEQNGKLNGEIVKNDVELEYEVVNGVKFDVETLNRPSGTSIDDAQSWTDLLPSGTGPFRFTTDSSMPFYFFAVKLKAGVNYSFDSDTNYDDQFWFYNSSGSQIGVYDDPHFTHTPSTDDIYYIKIGGYYGNNYGYSNVTINPRPEEYPLAGKFSDTGFLYSEDANIVMDVSSKRTYSFWYMYDNDLSGTLFELSNDDTSCLMLYLKDNSLYMNEPSTGDTLLMTFSDDKSEFIKKDEKDFCHMLFMYDPETQYVTFKFDGQTKFNSTILLNLVSTRITFGDSIVNTSTSGVLDGRIKALRAYNRTLTDEESESLRTEFDSNIGNGKTYENPLGLIPKDMEDDTLYLVRRYNDGTKLRLDFNNQKISKVGIYGFPKSGDEELFELPDEVSSCPWLLEDGDVLFYEVGSNSGFSSDTMIVFDLRNLNIIRNKNSSNYIFDINISDKNSIFRSKNCRWSSDGCDIDETSNIKFDGSAYKYVRYKNILGKLDFKNSKVIFTNDYHDAFRIINCERAEINNVDIYSSTYGSDSWNGFCFSFIRGHSSSYDYDDIDSYTSSSYVNYLFMKDIRQHIRPSEATSMNGIVLSVDCKKVYMENISSTIEDEIATPSSSTRWRNGLIHIRTGQDHYFSNLSVQNKYCSYIPSHSVIELRLHEQDSTWRHGTPNINRLMQNISIVLSDSTSNTNSSSERSYYSTSGDFENMYLYTALSIMNYSTPHYMVSLIKDVYVKAPGSKAISLRGVKGINIVSEGVVSMLYASADIESITQRDGYNALSIWRQAYAKIKTINISNYNGGEVVVLNDACNFSVCIDECNAPINSISYGSSGSYRNDAMIYCKNTIYPNGFFLKGGSQAVLPTQYRRNNGAEASLRLCTINSQNDFFRIPPHPHDGIAAPISAGKNKLTIHFANSLTSKYTDFVNKKLFIEVLVDGFVYDSRIDGKWSVDESEWNRNELERFKFEVFINTKKEETAYIRVYYNIETNMNGGLFMDPKFDWE